MNYIDLVSLLRAYGSKGLEKVQVYGRIVKQLPRPTNLHDTVKLSSTGIFVEMSVFAVNLGYHQSYLKQNGIWNKDNIYMVNGSICTFIEPSGLKLPDWYALDGTLRFGSKDTSINYVSLLKFYKEKDGSWGIAPSVPYDIDISYWDRNSDYYGYINKSWVTGLIEQPQAVKVLPSFSSTMIVKQSLASSLSNMENGVVPRSMNKTSNIVTFHKECRNIIKEPNETYKKYSDNLHEAMTSRENFLKSLSCEYAKSDDNDYLKYMLDGLVANLKHKSSPQALTGRAVLKKYLDGFKYSKDKYIGKTTVGDYLVDIFDEISAYILDHDKTINADGIAWDLCKSAFANKYTFYASIVGIILGVDLEELTDAASVCIYNDIDIIRVLNENPYVLQFVSGLRFNDIEKIALCFQRHNDKSLDSYRNIAMLNDFINDKSCGSTLFSKTRIMNSAIGITLTSAKYKQIKDYGTYLTVGLRENVNNFIKEIRRASDVGYEYREFVSVSNYQYVKKISASDLSKAINDYKTSGLGVVFSDGNLTSYSLLAKELFVFETMRELGSRRFDYSKDNINKYIAEYEEIIGFKLEERQREAVHLLVNAGFVVAGSAGSGKTTVSNCIVYVLSKLEPTLNIQFAAPTGKAAKRMQEVVKQEVKTLHSKFKIGQSIENEFVEDDEDSESSNVAYFFDEGAMITLDLLYKVLKKIDTSSSRIFLFGDFNQLPPIGKGLPFKNLLRFMPCVFLNVSKRAADGSNITKNSNYVNEYSDASNWKDLESGDDFFLLPCKSEQIQKVVYDLCAFYLGKKSEEDMSLVKRVLGIERMPKVEGLTPDQIQVVSPLAKDTYAWGTNKLNKILQPLFNPVRTYTQSFIYQVYDKVPGIKFNIGDRVIHVDKNMYSMQWYGTYNNGYFEKKYGFGICNGEVGKIVGFYPSNDCRFGEEHGQADADFEYPASLRDDTSWIGDNKWFVVVEYYDYISEENFYILYRAELNSFIQSNEGTVFKGDDLTKLNLFYAGTTHKLQGSQAKLIICPLDSVSFDGFITREMIYTMFTRGEKLVFGVGSVDNSRSSMLSRARRDIACSDTVTVGEVIV